MKLDKLLLKYEGGQIDPPPQEKLPSKSPALLGSKCFECFVAKVGKVWVHGVYKKICIQCLVTSLLIWCGEKRVGLMLSWVSRLTEFWSKGVLRFARSYVVSQT